MRAGKLSKRITIQQLIASKDTEGGNVEAWADWKRDCRAEVRPLAGTERRATSHGGEVSEARTEFIIRYRQGIDETMRVAYGGKLYNIRHVKDVNEAHEMLVLTCDTGVNDG